jgi:plasmid stabilization system protein ParE
MIVEWTETATTHVVAIRDYLLSVSSMYAQVVADRIVRKTEMLEQFPYLGGVVPEYKDESLREILEYPYRIMYRVLEDRVQIVAVIHGARRLPRTPPG